MFRTQTCARDLGRARRWRHRTLGALSGAVALFATSHHEGARAEPPRPGPAALSCPAPAAQDSQAFVIRSAGTLHVDYATLARSLASGLGSVNAAVDAPGRTSSSYDISATLLMRVLEVDALGSLVAMRLVDVDARFDGQLDGRSDLLEAPLLATLAADGSLHALKFPRGYPQPLAEVIRDLVTPALVALPRESASSWIASEVTHDGLFELAHTVETSGAGAISVRRTRTPVPTPSAERMHFGSAIANVELEPGTCQLLALDSTEDLTTRQGQSFVGRHQGKVTVYRTTVSEALPMSLAEAEAQLADPAFARARLYDVEPHVASRIEGRTLDQMLSDFVGEVGKNQASAHLLLENWVRRYPASARSVLWSLAPRITRSDDPALVIGFAAVAAAGHLEAQQALVEVLLAPRATPELRERALIAVMDLAMPEPFVLDAVWSTRTQLHSEGPKKALAVSLATNVYGALGDAARDNPEVTDAVLATLSDELSRAADRYDTIYALDALANVGEFARVAPLAAPHFASPDPAVRVSAFGTFRRMPQDEAFERFARHFSAETDAGVRHEAARIARDMAPTPARNAWAKAVLSTERDTGVLLSIVRLLGDELASFPDNTRVLRELLDHCRERSVRREVYAYITPAATQGGRQ